MRFLKLAFRKETAIPMLALTFASGVCLMLVAARIIYTGKLQYAFLIWNLFLAWLPLILALLASEKYGNGSSRNWRFVTLACAWLLFFPNAPYIFTDLIHLTRGYFTHFWVDMVLILTCALTGLIIGFLSLFLMQSIVLRMFGRTASWFFIAAVAGLSGIGIYLGRFERLNSWDILFKPMALSRRFTNWATDPLAHSGSIALAGLFATFLFIAYLMLYALTHLKQQPAPPLPELPKSRTQM